MAVPLLGQKDEKPHLIFNFKSIFVSLNTITGNKSSGFIHL